MRCLLVPYHQADPLPHLAEVALGPPEAACDAVIVSQGPPGAMMARILDGVAKRVAASDEPIVVASGDCTTALGTIAGLQRRALRPSVVWIDAHADFHTPRTTRSGYLGGMALAMAMGRTGRALTEPLGFDPIADDRCALVGAREIEDAEREALDASAVVRIAHVGDLASAPLPAPPWYVHLDIDVLASAGLPPLRFPVPGGPSSDEMAAALRALAERGAIAALGLGLTFSPRAFDEPAGIGDLVRPLVDAALAVRPS